MDTAVQKGVGYWHTNMTEHHFMTMKDSFTDTLTVTDTILKMSSTVMTDFILIETEYEVVDCLIINTICLQTQVTMVSVQQITATTQATTETMREATIDTKLAILSS